MGSGMSEYNSTSHVRSSDEYTAYNRTVANTRSPIAIAVIMMAFAVCRPIFGVMPLAFI
jgi:hypothetical protein